MGSFWIPTVHFLEKSWKVFNGCALQITTPHFKLTDVIFYTKKDKTLI